MKYFILSLIFTFPTFSFAESRLSIEVISTNHGEEVWVNEPGNSQAYKIGRVEVLKKGTYLYHWGNATAEQAEAWNKVGRITPEHLNALMQTSGAAGGGFYVSTNPIDSSSYGNTLVVVELPKDIRIVRATVGNTTGQSWTRMSQDLLQMGFSGVGVGSFDSWMSITDVDALSKEFVPTKNFLEGIKIDRIFSPYQSDIRNFTKSHKKYAALTPFRGIWKRTEKVMKDLKSGGDLGVAAFDLIAVDSDKDMKLWASANGHSSGVTKKFIESCRFVPSCLGNLLNNMEKSHSNYDFLVGESLKTEDSKVHARVFDGLENGKAVSDITRTFQDVEKFWGQEIPSEISDYIAKLKIENRWHPHMFCSQVFGGL